MSARAFSIAIGLKSPQIFYEIKAGKCAISRELAHRIQCKFEKINTGWLLTGEGEMLRNSGQVQVISGENAHHFTQSGNVTAAVDGALSELIREFSETRKAFNDTILANNKTIDRLLALIEKLTSS